MVKPSHPPACQGVLELQEPPAELQRQKAQEGSERIGMDQDTARDDSLDSEYARKENSAVLLRKVR
jgi:hypothetical protein